MNGLDKAPASLMPAMYRCFIVNLITLQDVAAQNLPAWAGECGDGQEPILLKVHSERNTLPDTCICRVRLSPKAGVVLSYKNKGLVTVEAFHRAMK